MKLLSRVFAALLVLTQVRAPAAGAAPSDSAPATLIVLDASGSMLERIKGETKIAIAKRSVRELVTSLPEGVNLGLVVYSHRKQNDCDDIELLIPSGKLDKAAFIAAVERIQPKGRTPLSAAIEFAASALDYRKKPANVILVSDGVETCGKDPCATAARLKKAGAGLVVHTVAFDLSARDAKSIKCIASATGGRFLQAKDAASLKDALSVVVTEAVTAPTPKPAVAPAPDKAAPPPPPAPVVPVSLAAPEWVLAGSEFEVAWTGPNRAGDFVTLVPKTTPDDEAENLVYTQRGWPLKMTALLEAGDAELRYVDGQSHAVLGRAPIKIQPIEASVNAAAEAPAGSQVSVEWKGPNAEGDYITIVPEGTPDREYAHYANTRDGSPAVVLAPIDPGSAVIRYHSGQAGHVLARRPIKLLPPEISLAAPDQAASGSVVEIAWKGPNNPGDYLTIVLKSEPEGSYQHHADTQAGPTVSVTAPPTPGDCEIRYVAGQGGKTLARRAIKVLAGAATLEAPAEAVANSAVRVSWTGPNNNGDYVTIVPKGAAEGDYGDYAQTHEGSPLEVDAPGEAGEVEIRYVAGQDGKTLARRALRVVAASVTLQSPRRAPAGSSVPIDWTGPNNDRDFITIVSKGTRDGEYANYEYTSAGSPLDVIAPEKPGACEIRYMNGADEKVLARIPIEITPAEEE